MGDGNAREVQVNTKGYVQVCVMTMAKIQPQAHTVRDEPGKSTATERISWP